MGLTVNLFQIAREAFDKSGGLASFPKPTRVKVHCADFKARWDLSHSRRVSIEGYGEGNVTLLPLQSADSLWFPVFVILRDEWLYSASEETVYVTAVAPSPKEVTVEAVYMPSKRCTVKVYSFTVRGLYVLYKITYKYFIEMWLQGIKTCLTGAQRALAWAERRSPPRDTYTTISSQLKAALNYPLDRELREQIPKVVNALQNGNRDATGIFAKDLINLAEEKLVQVHQLKLYLS